MSLMTLFAILAIASAASIRVISSTAPEPTAYTLLGYLEYVEFGANENPCREFRSEQVQ